MSVKPASPWHFVMAVLADTSLSGSRHYQFWTLLPSFMNFISLFFLTLIFFCSAEPLSISSFFPPCLFFYLPRESEMEKRHLAPSIPRCVERFNSPKLPSASGLQGHKAKSFNIVRCASPFLDDSDHIAQLLWVVFSHMLKKKDDANSCMVVMRLN